MSPPLPVLLTLAALWLAGCRSPCEERNGSVDGYCDGNVANNCLTDCADCVDQWKSVTCEGTCTVGDTLGPMDKAGGTQPNMSQPEAYAACSEWSEADTGE
jgi:hypothetical protein